MGSEDGTVYIYRKNGIHIIDLQHTVQMAKDCYNYLRDFVKDGKKILFVGTKKQARSSIEKEATRCNMPYISNRWLGGLLTNYQTVKKSIDRMKMLEDLESNDKLGTIAKTKKEKLMLSHELEKLKNNLIGIKDMEGVPAGLIVIDPKREHIAVAEAKKLGLKIFAVIDTNCNPDVIDYAIPGNDDAIRAISLFLNIMAEAIIEGTGQEFSEDGLSIVEDNSEESSSDAPASVDSKTKENTKNAEESSPGSAKSSDGGEPQADNNAESTDTVKTSSVSESESEKEDISKEKKGSESEDKPEPEVGQSKDTDQAESTDKKEPESE